MEKKVQLSGFSIFLSALTIILLVSIPVWQFRRGATDVMTWTLIGLLVCVFVSCLLYAPLSIGIDKNNLVIKRVIKTKRIALNDIQSVEMCPPTMGQVRLCGNGGFFGYWGWFYEKDLGRYFGYFGKASDCFLITLKNGRKYMLGCNGAPQMVAAIKATLR